MLHFILSFLAFLCLYLNYSVEVFAQDRYASIFSVGAAHNYTHDLEDLDDYHTQSLFTSLSFEIPTPYTALILGSRFSSSISDTLSDADLRTETYGFGAGLVISAMPRLEFYPLVSVGKNKSLYTVGDYEQLQTDELVEYSLRSKYFYSATLWLNARVSRVYFSEADDTNVYVAGLEYIISRSTQTSDMGVTLDLVSSEQQKTIQLSFRLYQ